MIGGVLGPLGWELRKLAAQKRTYLGLVAALLTPVVFVGALSFQDKLAIGFSLGLLHLPTIAALLLIATQAFFVAQVGLRLGDRISATLREGAEKLVGIALIAVGVFLLIEQILS